MVPSPGRLRSIGSQSRYEQMVLDPNTLAVWQYPREFQEMKDQDPFSRLRRRVISDTIKGLFSAWQLSYAAVKIRNESNVNLWRIKSSCAIISLIYLAWVPGLHNPYGYEWEIYLTFSAVSTGLQLNQLLFLALILSNAAYAATLMTKFAPANLPKLVFLGMSIVSTSMFAGLVGVLITNSLRWNSSRYFAAVATVAIGGAMVVMSAVRLRALLLKTQETFPTPVLDDRYKKIGQVNKEFGSNHDKHKWYL
eukprot:jgi/Bigna1/67816/fgenesh1_pg.4_\